MVSQTNEQALEVAIERQLTGTCLEELKAKKDSENEVDESQVPFDTHHGYELRYPMDFNARFCVNEKWFWRFLEKTQKKELAKLSRTSRNKDEWQRKILERLDRMIKKNGLTFATLALKNPWTARPQDFTVKNNIETIEIKPNPYCSLAVVWST